MLYVSHLGSVTDLLVAAATYEGEQRADRYKPRLDGLAGLPDLVTVAGELHPEEVEYGGMNVLTWLARGRRVLVGAASARELRRGLMEASQPWMQVVEATVERVLRHAPYANVVKMHDLSFAVTWWFLGVELMHTFDPVDDTAPTRCSRRSPRSRQSSARCCNRDTRGKRRN